MAAEDRNLFILSFSFFFVFLAFSTTQTLESSIQDGDLGTIAIGVIYGTLTAGGFVAPRILERIGPNKGICYGLATYVLFILSNLYLRWFTVIPSALLMGVGAAVLWSAQGVYLSALAPSEQLASRASGIFFCIYQSSQLAGNTIAYFVLHSGDDDGDSGSEVSESTKNLLFTIFSASAIVGTFLSTLMKNSNDLSTAKYDSALQRELNGQEREEEAREEDQGGEQEQDFDQLMVTDTEEAAVQDFQTAESANSNSNQNQDGDSSVLIHRNLNMFNIILRDSKLRNLIPVFFFVGMQQAFTWNEFTAHVTKPVVGEANVPLVMIFFGGFDALLSWILGKIGSDYPKWAARFLMIAVVLPTLLVSYIGFVLDLDRLKEKSNGTKWPVLLLFAVLFGYVDAATNTCVTAIIASSYRNQSQDDTTNALAFSHFKVWSSLATCLAFLYSGQVSFFAKCIITVSCGIFGFVGLLFARLDKQ